MSHDTRRTDGQTMPRAPGDQGEQRHADEDRRTSGSSGSRDPIAAVERLLDELLALKHHAAYYASVRAAGLKAKLQRIVIHCVIVVLGCVVLGTLIVSATIQFSWGIARGFATLFPGNEWLGVLLSGIAILCVLSLAVYVAVLAMRRSALKRAVKNHVEWRARVAADGNSTPERAATPTPQ